jgi:hypothetical protein
LPLQHSQGRMERTQNTDKTALIGTVFGFTEKL